MSTNTGAGPLPIQEQPSHTWPLGAIAELIDNSYARATKLAIDGINMKSRWHLTFKDDGAGMNKEGLTKMLSEPIGQYGNGFKSGSMRLAEDALVITRSRNSASIGLLSETYRKNIKTETVHVPIIEYKLPEIKRLGGSESKKMLDIILQYSPFANKENELKKEIRDLGGASLTNTGTKIILYNLKTLGNGETELDFTSDSKDIRCRKTPDNRPIEQNSCGYKHSLREYCSILYFHPKMKILIQGIDVKPKFIARSLNKTKQFTYKLTGQIPKVVMTFGYTCEEGPSKDYGVMLYHKNRLIKAYEKVGCQKQKTGRRGVDVVGVVQVDTLTPTHNKQDFVKDEKYNSIKTGLPLKLNKYLKDMEGQIEEGNKKLPDWLWVHCNKCFKWRRLPKGTEMNSLLEPWYCDMNPDSSHNHCDTAEEADQADTTGKPKGRSAQKKKPLESNDAGLLKLPSPVAAEKVLNKQVNVSQANTEQINGLPPSIHLPTQTAAKNIWNKSQENVSALNAVVASSSLPHISAPAPMGKKKIAQKRKNVSHDPSEISSTSISGDDDAPQPKQAHLHTKNHPQDAAKNILASIMKRKKQLGFTKPTTSSNQHLTAHNLITNSGNSQKVKDASIQTEILTSFHHNVHELLTLLTESDPGNVEDIEAVVASVLEGYRP